MKTTICSILLVLSASASAECRQVVNHIRSMPTCLCTGTQTLPEGCVREAPPPQPVILMHPDEQREQEHRLWHEHHRTEAHHGPQRPYFEALVPGTLPDRAKKLRSKSLDKPTTRD